MRMDRLFARVALPLLIFALAVPPACAADESELARATFLRVFRVSRAPAAEQVKALPAVLKELFPLVDSKHYHLLPLRSLVDWRTLEPEAAAKRVEKEGGTGWLFELAERECAVIAAKHPAEMERLARKELQGEDSRMVLSTLHLVGSAELKGLMGEVLSLLEHKDGTVGMVAQETLRSFNDPRAIRPLAERLERTGSIRSDVLNSLQRNRPADPVLVRLLKSPKPQVRRCAVQALSGSGDPALAVAIPELLKDADPQIRTATLAMGFLLPDKQRRALHKELLKGLEDPDPLVRMDAACMFADKKDPAVGPALLRLLRDTTLDELQHSRGVQAMNTLSGSYWGYELGSPTWKPTTPANQQAIRRFEAWVKAHPVD